MGKPVGAIGGSARCSASCPNSPSSEIAWPRVMPRVAARLRATASRRSSKSSVVRTHASYITHQFDGGSPREIFAVVIWLVTARRRTFGSNVMPALRVLEDTPHVTARSGADSKAALRRWSRSMISRSGAA